MEQFFETVYCSTFDKVDLFRHAKFVILVNVTALSGIGCTKYNARWEQNAEYQKHTNVENWAALYLKHLCVAILP